MAARVVGAALSTVALAGCGGLKEDNPLLLPVAAPIVVGAEIVLAFQPRPTIDLAPSVRWTYPGWNPLETDGLWVAESGSVLRVQGSNFELVGPCGTLSGVVRQPHLLQADYGKGYILETAATDGDPGCIGKPEAAFQNAFVFGSRSEEGGEEVIVRFYGGVSEASGKVILPRHEFFLTFPSEQP